MFCFKSGGCTSNPRKRTAAIVAALVAAGSGVAVSFLDKKKESDGAAPGDSSGWLVPVLVIAGAALLALLVLAMLRWRSNEEG